MFVMLKRTCVLILVCCALVACTPKLHRIKMCESGGNYHAVSPSGKYRGAYQFDAQTWRGIGGKGDPAAASPAEQDYRAWKLYQQRGSAPWPVCGRK